MPKSLAGKWAVRLEAGFLLSLGILSLVAALGQKGGETFSDNWWLAVPGVLAGVCGVSGFFAGIFAILKQKERSVAVFATTFVGLLVLWFLLGEILVPH